MSSSSDSSNSTLTHSPHYLLSERTWLADTTNNSSLLDLIDADDGIVPQRREILEDEVSSCPECGTFGYYRNEMCSMPSCRFWERNPFDNTDSSAQEPHITSAEEEAQQSIVQDWADNWTTDASGFQTLGAGYQSQEGRSQESQSQENPSQENQRQENQRQELQGQTDETGWPVSPVSGE